MRERKANGAANESRTTVRVMARGQAAVATFWAAWRCMSLRAKLQNGRPTYWTFIGHAPNKALKLVGFLLSSPPMTGG
jgi:hypothetical protein